MFFTIAYLLCAFSLFAGFFTLLGKLSKSDTTPPVTQEPACPNAYFLTPDLCGCSACVERPNVRMAEGMSFPHHYAVPSAVSAISTAHAIDILGALLHNTCGAEPLLKIGFRCSEFADGPGITFAIDALDENVDGDICIWLRAEAYGTPNV